MKRPTWWAVALLAVALPAPAVRAQEGGGPSIVEMVPADGALHVSLDAEIGVRFDRPVDPATLAGDFQPSTTDFTIEWSEGDRVMRLALSGPLAPETTYLLSIDNVFDAQGRSLANPQRSCFSTGATRDCPSFECLAFDATDAGVPSRDAFAYAPPFDASSPWNTPIAPGAPADPGSAVMVARLAATFEQFGGFWLGVARDVPPIYFAEAGTARVDVPLTTPNAGVPAALSDVPIPAHAVPDCGYDGFLAILDLPQGWLYELHRARRGEDGTWTAATGGSIDWSGGSGIHPGDGERSSTGVRASGGSLAAGLIWPHELAAGRIDHALAFGYEQVRSGGPVPPFTASDGQSDAVDAIPMGARLQLDPALDLDALGLPSWERTVARALQEYGAFLVDSAGGLSLPALHVHAFRGNPYAGLLPDSSIDERGVLLQGIPPAAFRVLAPP